MRWLMLGLVTLAPWAAACDLAPPLEMQVAWELDGTWTTCPKEWSSGTQAQTLCIASPLTVKQLMRKLEGLEGAQPTNRGSRVVWQYGNVEQGEVFKLNRISLQGWRGGSLLVWEKDAERARLAHSLAELLRLNSATKAGSPCVLGSGGLPSQVKSCVVVSSDGRQSFRTTTLKLTFNKTLNSEVQRGKTYFYSTSPICPIWQLWPEQP